MRKRIFFVLAILVCIFATTVLTWAFCNAMWADNPSWLGMFAYLGDIFSTPVAFIPAALVTLICLPSSLLIFNKIDKK